MTTKPLSLARAGIPTPEFLGAANQWNKATFHTTGTDKTASPVKLPMTVLDSEATAPADMAVPDIMGRLAYLEILIPMLVSGSVGRVNSEFEQKALNEQLKAANVVVSVRVNKSEDYTGNDDVFVKVAAPGGRNETSDIRTIKQRYEVPFFVPLQPLLGSPSDNLVVEVYEHDLLDPDDLIATTMLGPPWAEVKKEATAGRANYTVSVRLQR